MRITGTTVYGNTFKKKIRKGLKTLDLYKNHLSMLDISPLAQCKKLERLYLDFNHLSALDLSPLRQCTELKWLDLSFNRFSSIDLSPLAQCQKLEMLFLHSNHLSALDLTPLAQCPELEKLKLDDAVLLSWSGATLPAKETLPIGLKTVYSRLTLQSSPLVSSPTLPQKRSAEKVTQKEFSINFAERERNLRSIIERYRKISLEVMADLLAFPTILALQKWLLTLAGKYDFYIDKTEVVIPKGLKPANITELMEHLEAYRELSCYFCGFPLEKDNHHCPDCGRAVLKCIVCKLAINFGEDVGQCPLCEAKAHLVHLQEWVKTKGTCPQCLQPLPLEGILTLSKQASSGKKTKEKPSS